MISFHPWNSPCSSTGYRIKQRAVVRTPQVTNRDLPGIITNNGRLQRFLKPRLWSRNAGGIMSAPGGSDFKHLIGRRVLFREDDEHAGCWHFRVGLKSGVVLKIGQTLAQKAELMGPDSPIPAELLAEEEEAPRLWIKVDPCKLFPRGIEAAVPQACLHFP
jgi:hypothetical protein